MWMITPVGFFSIVQKFSDKSKGTLTVRARVKSDLENLKQHYLPELGDITETRNTDYRYRAVAPRSAMAAAMTRLVDELSYDNFKNEVARRQGYERAHLYHGVWDVLHRMQHSNSFESNGEIGCS